MTADERRTLPRKPKRMMMIGATVCFLLMTVALGHSKDQDKIASNMELGRKVFVEIDGGGKVELVDQLYAENFVDDSPGGGKGVS